MLACLACPSAPPEHACAAHEARAEQQEAGGFRDGVRIVRKTGVQPDVQSPSSNPPLGSVPNRKMARVTSVSDVTPGIDKTKVADPLTNGLCGPLPLMLPPPWVLSGGGSGRSDDRLIGRLLTAGRCRARSGTASRRRSRESTRYPDRMGSRGPLEATSMGSPWSLVRFRPVVG